jgi:hypothetical protein
MTTSENKRGWIAIETRYSNRCTTCREQIEIGAIVMWLPGTTGVECVRCHIDPYAAALAEVFALKDFRSWCYWGHETWVARLPESVG